VPKEAKCDFPSASVLGFGAVTQPVNTNRAVTIHEKQTILIMPKIPFLIVIKQPMLCGCGYGGNSSIKQFYVVCAA
jgi:hypothetical protein